MELFEDNTKGAIFSKDQNQRYMLFRIWDVALPKVMFIGLNPSTADEHKNDPTINRVMEIAKHNGFGGIYMLNLFSCVTPKPEEITWCELSKEINLKTLLAYAKLSSTIVFAWGNFKEAQTYGNDVIAPLFPNSYCLKKNKNGSPKHPLYCKKETKLIKF